MNMGSNFLNTSRHQQTRFTVAFHDTFVNRFEAAAVAMESAEAIRSRLALTDKEADAKEDANVGE